jgi:hypothetical protein
MAARRCFGGPPLLFGLMNHFPFLPPGDKFQRGNFPTTLAALIPKKNRATVLEQPDHASGPNSLKREKGSFSHCY